MFTAVKARFGGAPFSLSEQGTPQTMPVETSGSVSQNSGRIESTLSQIIGQGSELETELLLHNMGTHICSCF